MSRVFATCILSGSVKMRSHKPRTQYDADLSLTGKCQNMLSWLDFSTILKHYGH